MPVNASESHARAMLLQPRLENLPILVTVMPQFVASFACWRA
jgi:hypothetical protein